MKKIKFRAWDKKEKKMLQSKELCRLCFNEGIPCAFFTWDNNFVMHDGFILMQYTGLKDKNGKEIYEGDIVKCKLSSTQRYKGIIQFQTGHFFIQTFWYHFKPIGRWDLEERKLCGESTTQLNIDCVMEVIGNTYENSKLLKENK